MTKEVSARISGLGGRDTKKVAHFHTLPFKPLSVPCKMSVPVAHFIVVGVLRNIGVELKVNLHLPFASL